MTDDSRGQYLVLASPHKVLVSARPDNGVSVLVENSRGKIITQVRYIAGWRHLQIMLVERIDP